jgi:hypothetical protein
MTPQSNVMVLATIDPHREAELRTLLDTMNSAPGAVDRQNALIPFAQMKGLHFARLVILDDKTLDDITVYGKARINFPQYLALMCEFDGLVEPFLDDLVRCADEGLRKIFSLCQDYSANSDIRDWIRAHNVQASASYVNWVGRTVSQVGEEEALRQTLAAYLRENSGALRGRSPSEIRALLQQLAAAQQRDGNLSLTPPQPTPASWQIRNIVRLIGIPLVLLVLSPLILLYLPFFLIQLRLKETSDPVVAPRVDPEHANELARIEDQDVTNQFSAMGSLKPGPFRRLTISFVFLAIDYTAAHIFNRGRLARVTTIHFARWVFLDGGKRVIFASNYDGSLESYMDDFINKVSFGLNVVFSNGLGYPRTNWLLLGGAKDEQNFKNYLRRHQIPTQVWYNAYPGLTALDRRRNALVREGLEQPFMTNSEAEQWLRLF